MCCAGYKYDGMGNAIEKRKCAMQTPVLRIPAGMGKEERWDYVAPAKPPKNDKRLYILLSKVIIIETIL